MWTVFDLNMCMEMPCLCLLLLDALDCHREMDETSHDFIVCITFKLFVMYFVKALIVIVIYYL